MKTRTSLILIIFLIIGLSVFGQSIGFRYQRPIQGISQPWHKLIIPDDLYCKATNGLADLRIIGITSSGDTIQAPYLLKRGEEKLSYQVSAFKKLNQTYNRDGAYLTFQLPESATINEMQLTFSQSNFNWLCKLEGSQDLKTWYTLTDNFRIISFNQEGVSFQSTKLVFPDARFTYFRVSIRTQERPDLRSATFTRSQPIKSVWKSYSVAKMHITEDKNKRQTILNILLKNAVPISQISFPTQQKFDYFRPCRIEALTDSFQTRDGWKEHLVEVGTGVLTSSEEGPINFPAIVASKLKITIDNHDNQPLTFQIPQVGGYQQELYVRFQEPANYFLLYGNSEITAPNYDLTRYEDRIPTELTPVTLGQESLLKINPTEKPTTNPFWLWLVMGTLIAILGWFSMKMLVLRR